MIAQPGEHGRTRQRLLLAALFCIFAAPFVGAWLLLNFTDVGRHGGGSHGRLFEPPRALPDVALAGPDGGADTARLYRKWTLLFLTRVPCAPDCAENLHRMRQLRLALGVDAERIQRVLAVYGGAPDGACRELLRQYPGQRFLDGAAFDRDDPGASFRLAPGEDAIAAGRLYLIDPHGNLILSYAAGADPDGIIADLRRLLRYSHIG